MPINYREIVEKDILEYLGSIKREIKKDLIKDNKNPIRFTYGDNFEGNFIRPRRATSHSSTRWMIQHPPLRRTSTIIPVNNTSTTSFQDPNTPVPLFQDSNAYSWGSISNNFNIPHNVYRIFNDDPI